jgi:hypothetical protein
LITSNFQADDRELRIEGFIANQNVQSTKNSISKQKPLKAKKSGIRGEMSDISDPGIVMQHKMMKQSSFRWGDRNIPKYRLLSKPMSSELSDDIQPTCHRINSAILRETNNTNNIKSKPSINLKARSNSSNALNKTEEDLQNSDNSNKNDVRKNYHSAQRSQQNTRNEKASQNSDPSVMLKAVKLAISDKRSWLVGNSRSNTQGIHLLPSTNKLYRNTKRIAFTRRMNMMDRPIIVISFEGIIGDFQKENIWSDKNYKLITRGNASAGLKLFWNYFQVVLYFKKTHKKNILKVKEWLKTRSILVDAIYGRKATDDNIQEDYAQVYNDFNIVSSKNIAKSIIVINSLDIDNSKISTNLELEKIIFNKNNGLTVSGLPYTINWQQSWKVVEAHWKPKSMLDMPLSLLFPNILTDWGDDLSMISIFKVVISIAFLSLKDYSENFKYSNLKLLKESDVKLQRQFLGLDLTNVCQKSYSTDNLLQETKWDEEASTTILSDSETKKVSVRHFK